MTTKKEMQTEIRQLEKRYEDLLDQKSKYQRLFNSSLDELQLIAVGFVLEDQPKDWTHATKLQDRAIKALRSLLNQSK